MAFTKKGLGRGLSALIPEVDMELLRQVARGESSLELTKSSKPQKNESLIASEKDLEEYRVPTNNIERKNIKQLNLPSLVRLDAIEANPYQPRRFFREDELIDLANSIREHGVIQPVIIRPLSVANGLIEYQLIAGERRWRASQLAGMDTIPALIRSIDDQQALELALIENVQRHDISSIDAALAYKRLANEFHLSQEDIARRVGKSRSAVANTLRLLDLNEDIRIALEKGEISEGHGRAILLATGEGARRALFRRIVRDKLSVREVERLAKLSENAIDDVGGLGNSNFNLKQDKLISSPETRRIETALQKRLGARVSIRARSRGGRIIIEYSSVEELQRVIRSIGA